MTRYLRKKSTSTKFSKTQPIPTDSEIPHHRLGLTENWVQFSIFTLITLLIGMTIGVERVALPPLAHDQFHITSIFYTVSFISAFGAVKAVMNLISGHLSDRHGRKTLLLIGWIFAIPFALLIIFAQSWLWVLAANLFLGINQGLTWSMSVTSKIDLVGPANRGLAVGLDESAGYIGVGLGSFAAGVLAASFGLRPAPYLMALVIVGLGLLLSALLAKETKPWADAESAKRRGSSVEPLPRLSQLASYMTWHDKEMFALCQAGFLNKFIDSLVIGFIPLYFLKKGLDVVHVGLIVGIYAWVWGLGQIATGALADRIGRKVPILWGISFIGLGVVVVILSTGQLIWISGAALMGIGMSLVYPNLISGVGDVAHPSWRGGALGVFRLWRDGGYAIGPLLLGGVSLLGGIIAALWTAVILMAISALIVAVKFHETEPKRRTKPFAWQLHPQWLSSNQ